LALNPENQYETMSNFTDTKPVRAGEELDEQNLSKFLHSNLHISNDAIEIKQFPAGSSNLTYSIKFGEQEFVLRRPPFGNTVKTAHDMKREFLVLSALSKVYSPAPSPLLFCDDEKIVGAEFYLMERKRGTILRGLQVPDQLTQSSALQRRVCESFVDNLAALHNLDYEKAGLGDLGKPEGYARRQTVGWTERYFKAKTDEHRELERAISWLSVHIPNDLEKPALVHNDYKFDNVMLDENDLTCIVAVLDWEMATVGDPLMDLGTTLGYWMDKNTPEFLRIMPFNPRVLMETWTRRELAQRYAEKTGSSLDNLLFYYVFGTFKIAVIAQQIYFRFVKGSTQDQRFANFNLFVSALGQIAANAIERGKV
jgi:aminoglycoside phosphotransferase (APT) family kinase protein